MWDVRYRPKLFSEVIGQQGTVDVLRSRLRRGTGLDTSYLICGFHGGGKTTLGRILARALLCSNLTEEGEPCNECDSCLAILNDTSMAFMELDAASRGTVENVRAIVGDLSFALPGAAKRIYLIDECHRATTAAQDVLLKPLEEKMMVAIFCTTEPAKVRGTIRSRCEEYTIRRISREDILERMSWILRAEKVEFEDDAVLTVIDHCKGHVRDTINRLEMISQMGKIDLALVRDHLDLALISTYYEILLHLGDPSHTVALVEAACDRAGADVVASGIAEAAMSSYRQHYGILSEFTFLDRSLAPKVFEQLGDQLVELAEYFLRSASPTKVSLVCQVIRCAKGLPSRQTIQSAGPPVVVQATITSVVAPAPVQSAAVVSEAPVPSQEAAPSERPPVAQASTPLACGGAAVESAAPASPPKAPGKVNGKAPGKVNGKAVGTDPSQLTTMDADVMNRDMPRGSRGGGPAGHVLFGGQQKATSGNVLSREEWCRLFRARWHLGRG